MAYKVIEELLCLVDMIPSLLLPFENNSSLIIKQNNEIYTILNLVQKRDFAIQFQDICREKEIDNKNDFPYLHTLISFYCAEHIYNGILNEIEDILLKYFQTIKIKEMEANNW